MATLEVGTIAERDALVTWYAPGVWLWWVGYKNGTNPTDGFWYVTQGKPSFEPSVDIVHVRADDTKYKMPDMYNPILTWEAIPKFGFQTFNLSGANRLAYSDTVGSVVFTKFLAASESGEWWPPELSDGSDWACKYTNFYPIVIPVNSWLSTNYTLNVTHGVTEGLPIQWFPIWGPGDTGHSSGSYLFIIGLSKIQ